MHAYFAVTVGFLFPNIISNNSLLKSWNIYDSFLSNSLPYYTFGNLDHYYFTFNTKNSKNESFLWVRFTILKKG